MALPEPGAQSEPGAAAPDRMEPVRRAPADPEALEAVGLDPVVGRASVERVGV